MCESTQRAALIKHFFPKNGFFLSSVRLIEPACLFTSSMGQFAFAAGPVCPGRLSSHTP